jgi:serine/threonine-protein kinase
VRGVENTLSTTGARDLAPGTGLADYVIEEIVGRGGMGVVYRATHPVIGSRVAIKVLASDRLSDPHAVSRFVQEARTANEIRHPNIVDVFTFGRLDSGQAYCVMEYLDGISLAQHLASVRTMTLADAISVLYPVARALDAAHGKGIIHRDIKPGNLFLVRDPDSGGIGQVKLLDFGIAKLLATSALSPEHHTATGSWVGTPAYMSPEQWNAKEVDARADVYSLGVVAYEMLTGRLPFPSDGLADMLLRQQTQPPVPASQLNPELPPAIDRVFEHALDKDPTRRFGRASALVTALANTAGLRTPASASTPIPRARGRRLWIPLAGAGLAVAIAGIAWWPRMHTDSPAAAATVQPEPAVTRPSVIPSAPAPSPPAADIPHEPAPPAPPPPAATTPHQRVPHRPSPVAPVEPHTEVVPDMPVKL